MTQPEKKPPRRQRLTDGVALDKAARLGVARAERVAKVSEQRRQLWQALNEYIRQRGEFVVSPPYASPLRVEIAKNSALPATLTKLGYRPEHGGTVMRVTSDGLRQMDVIVFDLPKEIPPTV